MKSEKEPIFIDYPAIHISPVKRLLYLKSLIKIINTNDNFINYENIGLKNEDVEFFKRYLSENYPEYFDPKKKSINLFENYNGKIICGIDLLLEDLFGILNNEKNTKEVNAPINPVDFNGFEKDNTADEIDFYKDSDRTLEYALKWIFLDQSEPELINEELEVHIRNIYSIEEDKIKEYFNCDRIIFELSKLYGGRTKREIWEEFFKIREKLLLFLDNFEKHFTDKQYWFDFKMESETIFKNIRDSIIISRNEKSKIFLIFKGDPDKNKDNPIISYYNNKVVLFNRGSPQYKNLLPHQIVLADLLSENPTYYIFNPKRILANNDALYMIQFGIEACPSKKEVLSAISGG
jgi:hypothetical protein